tara:strand:- start:769 stop:1230 length:462 start_codon:yes stop_codon:yes gene_type:complete
MQSEGKSDSSSDEESVYVVAIYTDTNIYDDFEHMLSEEGEPEFYEVHWSNGDITSPDGDFMGRVDWNATTEEDCEEATDHSGRIKTYAYKAYARCRKCGKKLYGTQRDFTGNHVEREPSTQYIPTSNKLRKVCTNCRFVWLELPKDYRDKSNG